jgi:hypothetical protein
LRLLLGGQPGQRQNAGDGRDDRCRENAELGGIAQTLAEGEIGDEERHREADASEQCANREKQQNRSGRSFDAQELRERPDKGIRELSRKVVEAIVHIIRSIAGPGRPPDASDWHRRQRTATSSREPISAARGSLMRKAARGGPSLF